MIETLDANLFHLAPLPCSSWMQSSMQRRVNDFFSLSTCSMSADELLEIFKRLAQEAGYQVSAAAEEQAKTYLQGRREQDGSSFGNARTVEQLFQHMEERLADRLVVGTEGELENVTFEADDV